MTITIDTMLLMSRFMDAHRNDPMSMKTAFKLNRLANALEPDMKLFQEKYQEIISTYIDEEATKLLPEGRFKVQEDKIADYTNALNELAQVELQIPDIKFSIDEFENFSATMEEVRSIICFIEE